MKTVSANIPHKVLITMLNLRNANCQMCVMNCYDPVHSGQAVVLVTLNPPKHAVALKALIGYSCGVLFVYHCVTTASLGSTHLIFIPNMKA